MKILLHNESRVQKLGTLLKCFPIHLLAGPLKPMNNIQLTPFPLMGSVLLTTGFGEGIYVQRIVEIWIGQYLIILPPLPVHIYPRMMTMMTWLQVINLLWLYYLPRDHNPHRSYLSNVQSLMTWKFLKGRGRVKMTIFHNTKPVMPSSKLHHFCWWMISCPFIVHGRMTSWFDLVKLFKSRSNVVCFRSRVGH